MEDLFKREQIILEKAGSYLASLPEGAPCSHEEYELLLGEYGRLLRQIRRITKISDRTAEELNASKNDLAERAYHDTLTGLYNRRYMEETLDWLMNNPERFHGCMSVIMTDVDHFKDYNDAYGHGVGDECLKTIAIALQSGVRGELDFAARYGGEEFLLVFPGMAEAAARRTAMEILERVRKTGIVHEYQKGSGYVTISAGVTSGRVRCKMNWKDMVRRADEALYHSKQSGRNRYTYMEYKEGI